MNASDLKGHNTIWQRFEVYNFLRDYQLETYTCSINGIIIQIVPIKFITGKKFLFLICASVKTSDKDLKEPQTIYIINRTACTQKLDSKYEKQ